MKKVLIGKKGKRRKWIKKLSFYWKIGKRRK
jgi:hypothetical protein